MFTAPNALKRLVRGLASIFSSSTASPGDNYLAEATDLADLERRQRELARTEVERRRAKLPHDYFSHG